MSDEPRYVPRFIPTLTEVVDPASLKVVTTKTRPNVQDLVDELQRQLLPVIERRIQQEYEQLLDGLLRGALRDMRERLQAEMQSQVLQVVSNYLAKQENHHK